MILKIYNKRENSSILNKIKISLRYIMVIFKVKKMNKKELI
jgi:hypothetical protein